MKLSYLKNNQSIKYNLSEKDRAILNIENSYYLLDDKELVGLFSLSNIYPNNLELRCVILEEHRRKGYAKALLNELLDKIFESNKNKEAIKLLIDFNNSISHKLARSNGFLIDDSMYEKMQELGEKSNMIPYYKKNPYYEKDKKTNFVKEIKMNKKGFTLIELLAVIVILGLIIGLVIPAAMKLFGKTSNDQHRYYEDIMVNSFKLYVKQNPGKTINCASLTTLLDKKIIKKSTCSGTSEGYVIVNPVYNNGSAPDYKDFEYLAYYKCTEGSNQYSTTYPNMPSGFTSYQSYNKENHCPNG